MDDSDFQKKKTNILFREGGYTLQRNTLTYSEGSFIKENFI